MKISNVLKPENIILDVTATTKAELIDELSQKLNDNGYLSDIEQFKKDIWAREEQVPTGGIRNSHSTCQVYWSTVPCHYYGQIIKRY